MYRFRKFIKYLGYSFVYILISLASTYGVINLSISYVKGETQTGAGGAIPVQISTMVDNFASANALELNLSALISTESDSYDINIDAILDLSQGFENLNLQGQIEAFINSNALSGAQQLNQGSSSELEPIIIDFAFVEGNIYLDALEGKIMMPTDNLMESVSGILSLANINFDDLGVGDILNMPLNDMLGMFSNIKEEIIDEEKNIITLVVALPMVGDVSLIFDTDYRLQGLYSNMAMDGIEIEIDGGIKYPEAVMVEAKNEDEYINAHNLLDVIKPALNFANNTQFAVDIQLNKDSSELANGKLYLDLESKQAKFLVNAFGQDVSLYFINNVIYIEYQNIFAKFDINDITKVQQFLADSFDITLPQDSIDMILGLLNGENVALPEMNLDLSSISLAFIENVDVDGDKTIITLKDIGTITLSAQEDDLAYLAYNGFGFDIEADIVKFENINLSEESNCYINLATFIPTIENTIDILRHNTLEGSIEISIDNQQYTINYTYDHSQNIALATTEIFDINFTIQYANNCVYLDIADKFKFVADCDTVIENVVGFIQNIGIALPEIDLTSIIESVLTIFDKTINPLLITGLTEIDNGFIITLLNQFACQVENGESSLTLSTSIDNIKLTAILNGTENKLNADNIEYDAYTNVTTILELAEKVYNSGLLNLISPALNIVESDAIGLNINATIDNITLPIEANISLAKKKLSLTTSLYGLDFALFYQKETFYVEAGNIYISFALTDFDKFETFLADNFNITLPSEIIDMLINVVTGKQMNIKDLLKTIDFDLASIDLSIFDNIHANEESATITLGETIITLNYSEESFTSIDISGIIDASIQFVEYQAKSLSLDKSNYIDATALFPTIQNVIAIANADKLYAKAIVVLDDERIEATLTYDIANKLLAANAQVLGYNVDVAMTDDKIYISVADKVKLMADTTAMISDLQSFLTEMDIAIEMPEIEQIITIITNILSPKENPLLIKSFKQTANGLIVKLFNDFTFALTNGSSEIAVNSAFNNGSIFIAIKATKQEIILPEIVESEYININTILNLVSTAYNKGLVNLIQPAMNTFASGNIALDINILVGQFNLPAQFYLSFADKSLAINSKINNIDLNIFYQDEIFFVEFGNLYLQFALDSFDELVAFLENNFGITLPSDIIATAIEFITAENISIEDMIDSFDFNLTQIVNSFDLAFFDKITVTENKATINLDRNIIEIAYTSENLVSIKFNDITADFIEFEQKTLSTDITNYINVTSFLPTIQNVMNILKSNVISGYINATIEETDYQIAFAYSQVDNTALVSTQIMGLDINFYLANNKVFVNVQDKFKLVANLNTFIDDISSFLTEMNIEMNVDANEILAEVANILNPALNTLLIKNFIENEDDLTITLFNDITIHITNDENAIVVASEIENIPVEISVGASNETLILAEIVENEYIDLNTILNIVSTAYNKGLFNLVQPAINTFASGEIALDINVTIENMVIPAELNLSIANKTLALSSEFNNTAFNLFYQDETFFVEYGNLYLQVALDSYTEIEAFLAENFGVTLPSELIGKAIELITAENISIEDMLNNFDFNLTQLVNSFDLAIFDCITVTDDQVTIGIDGYNIKVGYNKDNFTSIKFSDILSANFIEFKETTLSTDKANYIDVVAFLPTIQNVMNILESDVISGSINTTIEDQNIEIAFTYDQANSTALVSTQVLGFNLTATLLGNKVYVNLHDKLKLAANVNTFVDDITAFLAEMDIEINVDANEILAEVANILNPALNTLLIKNFIENEDDLTITLFNDITIHITNDENAIVVASEIENIPVEILVGATTQELTLPEINESEYTDLNVLFNLIAATYESGLTNLLAPALNTLSSGQLGATFTFAYDELQVEGHLSIDVNTLSVGINVNVRGIDVNIIILSDNVVYVEFGNLNVKFSLNDLTEIGDLLEKHFDITIPFGDILEIIDNLRTGNIDIIEMLKKFDITIDLNAIDLAFFDTITNENGVYSIPVENVGDFTIEADEENLLGFGYEGFGIKAMGQLSQYKVFDLKLLKEEYVNLVDFLPTIDNIIGMINNACFSGQITIYDSELDLNVPIDYVVTTGDELYVNFTTSIYGAHLSGQYYKDKIYLEFAESVKIVVDVTKLPKAIQEVLESAGKNLPQSETTGMLDNIFNVLMKGDTSSLVSTSVGLFDAVKSVFDSSAIEQLIKSFAKTQNGFAMTLFNDMPITLTNGNSQVALATSIDNISINLSVKGSQDAITIPTIKDSDYIPVENLLELVKAFLNMTHKDDFNIKGNLDIVGSLVGININMTVGLDAQVKITDGKVQFQAVLGEIPAIVGVNNDVPYKFGDTESGSDRYVYLYFDGEDLYIYRSEYVDIVFGASKRHYEKCTKISADTLLSDIMYYLQYMIGFTDTIMGEIEKAMTLAQNREQPIDLNNVVNNVACDGNRFDLSLNLKEIANNPLMGDLALNLLLNKDADLKSYLYQLGLNVYMPLADIFKLTLSSDDITIVNYGSTVDLSRLQDYVTNYKYGYGEEWEASNGEWGKAADKQYTIYFEENGGDEKANITGIYGAPITLPTYTNSITTDDGITKTVATFDGWWTTSNFKEGTRFTDTTMPKRDITLYAKWNKTSQYYRTIKFVTNSTDVVNSITQLEGTTVVVPYLNTKQETVGDETTTYSFGGWYKDSTCTEKFTDYKMPSQSIVLYAKWDFVKTETTKTFTLIHNGNTLYSYRIKTGNEIDLSSVSGITLTGSKPTLFYTDAARTNLYTGDWTMPEQDLTLYVKNAYTLTATSKFGNTATATYHLYEGDSLTLPTQSNYVNDDGNTRKTYTFLGYSENITKMPSENKTVSANWNEDIKYYYTISFDTSLRYIPKSCAAGCTYKTAPGSIAPMKLLEGTVIDLTQSKYQLTCQVWSTAISWGISYKYKSTTWMTSVPSDYSNGGSGLKSYTVTGNATLYPFWEKQ
ncbi:MAG: hypothetical protein E7379_04355 [Clostridiales bacterium]|nr:hypothetical protein [Clostridiales bacterium]